MQGQPSKCMYCGSPGEKFGVPSPYDACEDAEACRERVAQQRDRLKREGME